MDQAVTIHVTAIDNEYGFTMFSVRDCFSGDTLATFCVKADSLTKKVTVEQVK